MNSIVVNQDCGSRQLFIPDGPASEFVKEKVETMTGYINHFQSFIETNLPTYQDVFTREDMVEWILSRDNRQPHDIIQHLLKRTTNYQLRDNNKPPSKLDDDLFFMSGPNSFRRYQSGVDPAPFHVAPVENFDAHRLRGQQTKQHLTLPKKDTGDRGEKLALDELIRRGYKAFLKPTNHPIFDIECESSCGHKFTVQVKNSTAKGTQAWIGLKAVDGELRDDLYFILLRQWDSSKESPQFFVLTHRELKEAWQKMPMISARTGLPKKRTGHVAWKHFEDHLSRWNKLPS